jgi:hypothetical protein
MTTAAQKAAVTRREHKEQDLRLAECRQRAGEQATRINKAIQAGRRITTQTGFGPYRITRVNGEYDVWCVAIDPVTGEDASRYGRLFMFCAGYDWDQLVDQC